MYEYKNLKITKYLHDGFRIDYPTDSTMQDYKNIYIDPYKLPDEQPKADFILISHEHFDHLDKVSLQKILKVETVVIGNELVKAGLEGMNIPNFIEMNPNETKDFENFKIHSKPAYNINKFQEPGKPFHPKENNGLGFLLEFVNIADDENVFIYHTGDTDFINEMKEPMKVDIIMIPVSGTYVMSVQEAAEAINTIKPKIAIPMHNDAGIAGTLSDSDALANIAECEVLTLIPES